MTHSMDSKAILCQRVRELHQSHHLSEQTMSRLLEQIADAETPEEWAYVVSLCMSAIGEAANRYYHIGMTFTSEMEQF